MKTKTFYLTASGILVAILLVWAQLWNDLVNQYANSGYSTITADISLVYVYLAITTSLLAFIIILCRQIVGSVSRTFFGFSIVLTIIQVLGSLFSSMIKTTSGANTTAPLNFFVSLFSSNACRLIVLYLVPVIIFGILFLVFYFKQRSMRNTGKGKIMNQPEDSSTEKGKSIVSPEDFDKINNAYQTSIKMWKLASTQIYSRFSSMLTANSIILAIIGLTIPDRLNIPSWFVWILIMAGVFLCIVWLFFISQGVKAENYYREKVEFFETQAIPNGEEIVIRVNNPKYKGFLSASFIVVYIFFAIYLACIILFAVTK
jgi:hypothetical protein